MQFAVRTTGPFHDHDLVDTAGRRLLDEAALDAATEGREGRESRDADQDHPAEHAPREAPSVR